MSDPKNSILTSTKKMLGITEEYEHFDPDIITHINSVFSILTQLGVGDPYGFMITGKEEVWTDFLISRDPRLNMVKTYMYQKVRMMFDPPQAGALKEALQKSIDELEWRLNIQVDPATPDNTGYDFIEATDEEIQDLIEDLDSLGTGHGNCYTATDCEIKHLIHELDDLEYGEDESDEAVGELINEIDDLDCHDGCTEASQDDINHLINSLDTL